jgi:hypothetical protein
MFFIFKCIKIIFFIFYLFLILINQNNPKNTKNNFIFLKKSKFKEKLLDLLQRGLKSLGWAISVIVPPLPLFIEFIFIYYTNESPKSLFSQNLGFSNSEHLDPNPVKL